MAEMYGTKPLNMLETKGFFTLENGLYCVYGKNVDGISVDVYRDKKGVYKTESLVSMQHGIRMSESIDDPEVGEHLKGLIESFSYEFSE